MQSQSLLHRLVLGCIDPALEACGLAGMGYAVERFMGISDHLLTKIFVIHSLFLNVHMCFLRNYIDEKSIGSFKHFATLVLSNGLAIFAMHYFKLLDNPLVAAFVLMRASHNVVWIPVGMIRERLTHMSQANAEQTIFE